MPRPPRPALRGSSYDEYICIRNFMSAEGGMGLSGVKAQVYALIYSHSPADTLANDTGCYFGSIAYTAARIGASRSTTIDAIKWLLRNELIVEKGEHVQGDSSATKKYVVNRERALDAQIRFKEYWDGRAAEFCRETPSRPETVPETIPADKSDFSRPETVPGSACSRPETVPEIRESLDSSASRPETVPGSACSRPETVPDHVRKPDPITQVDSLSSSFSCNPSLSPSQTTPEPSVRRMGGESVRREIKEDLDSELLASVKALMLRSINQRAPFAEVLPAYRDALAMGYTPEQIDRGYTAYAARYRRQHPGDPSYAIRLSNYLVRGDGLAVDEPKPEQGQQARAEERRALMQELYDSGDPTFRALYDAVPTDDDVARGMATEGDQEIAKARLSDYLAYRQGKPNTVYERRLRWTLEQEHNAERNAGTMEVRNGR